MEKEKAKLNNDNKDDEYHTKIDGQKIFDDFAKVYQNQRTPIEIQDHVANMR